MKFILILTNTVLATLIIIAVYGIVTATSFTDFTSSIFLIKLSFILELGLAICFFCYYILKHIITKLLSSERNPFVMTKFFDLATGTIFEGFVKQKIIDFFAQRLTSNTAALFSFKGISDEDKKFNAVAWNTILNTWCEKLCLSASEQKKMEKIMVIRKGLINPIYTNGQLQNMVNPSILNKDAIKRAVADIEIILQGKLSKQATDFCSTENQNAWWAPNEKKITEAILQSGQLLEDYRYCGHGVGILEIKSLIETKEALLIVISALSKNKH